MIILEAQRHVLTCRCLILVLIIVSPVPEIEKKKNNVENVSERCSLYCQFTEQRQRQLLVLHRRRRLSRRYAATVGISENTYCSFVNMDSIILHVHIRLSCTKSCEIK